MDIVILIAYMFCSFGITELMLFFNGPFDILERFRILMRNIHPKLGELFSCPACLSTWIGALFSCVDYFIVPSVSFTPFNLIFQGTGLWWLIIPMDMFFTVGTTWTLYQLDEFLENNAKTYEDEE